MMATLVTILSTTSCGLQAPSPSAGCAWQAATPQPFGPLRQSPCCLRQGRGGQCLLGMGTLSWGANREHARAQNLGRGRGSYLGLQPLLWAQELSPTSTHLGQASQEPPTGPRAQAKAETPARSSKAAIEPPRGCSESPQAWLETGHA